VGPEYLLNPEVQLNPVDLLDLLGLGHQLAPEDLEHLLTPGGPVVLEDQQGLGDRGYSNNYYFHHFIKNNNLFCF
jgi:hypothetical protein